MRADGVRVRSPRPHRLEPLLASRGHRAIDLSGGGELLLATSTGGETLLFDLAQALPTRISERRDLVPLALSSDGAAALALIGEPGGRRTIARLGRDGTVTPVRTPAGEYRLVGRAGDRSSWYLASSAEGIETLLALDTATFSVRILESFPPGFEIAAVSASGRLVALRQPLTADADQVYLHERTAGATRLLLPLGDDGRFVPVGFSPDESSLLLLADGGAEFLGLLWFGLDAASGSDARLAPPVHPAPGCEVIAATLAADGETIATTRVCDGIRSGELLDASTFSPLAPPLLPRGTVQAAALALPRDGGQVVTVASGRTPRDLLFAPPQDALPRPLTWGLAPGIDPATLVDPVRERIGSEGLRNLPLELWLPGSARRADRRPIAALCWIESDEQPPRWNEFEPFFQFLAGRGIAVARFRLRGADGFGRRFRHAADGRPVAAAVADLGSVLTRLRAAGVPEGRVAVVASGSWPAAFGAALAYGRLALPAGQPVATIATMDAAGPDAAPWPDWDRIERLAEPAHTWWMRRLGVADAASREELGSPFAGTGPASDVASPATIPLFRLPGGRLDVPALWRFLEPTLRPPS